MDGRLVVQLRFQCLAVDGLRRVLAASTHAEGALSAVHLGTGLLEAQLVLPWGTVAVVVAVQSPRERPVRTAHALLLLRIHLELVHGKGVVALVDCRIGLLLWSAGQDLLLVLWDLAEPHRLLAIAGAQAH